MRILLVLLIIYFLYRVFFRFIFPIILKHFINRASQGMNGQFGQQFQQPQQPINRRPEGEVIIENMNDKKGGKPRSGDDEFVDFVEVK